MTRTVRWILAALVLAGVALLVLASREQAGPGAGARGPRPTAVRVAPVETGDLVVRRSYPGELTADAVDLAPETVGRLVAVEVEVGDRVEKGAVVARLDPSILRQQLLQAEAAVRAAQASRARIDSQIAALRAELERKEPLAARQLVSAQELLELRASLGALEAERAGADAEWERGRAAAGALREQLGNLTLRAPWDALVAARLLEPGATATANTPVLRLVRAGPLEVRFRVPERDAALVRPGLRIEATTQATGDEIFAGRVLRAAGEISRADRTLLVEGILEREHPVLRAGMFATVRLVAETLRGATLVPAAALLQRQGESGVFVAEGEVARWRPVRVLGEEAGIAAVEGTLSGGERVLVFGHDDLGDGAPIRVVSEQPPIASEGAP